MRKRAIEAAYNSSMDFETVFARSDRFKLIKMKPTATAYIQVMKRKLMRFALIDFASYNKMK